MGIPGRQGSANKIHSQAAGIFTAGNCGAFRIQSHRFMPDWLLHILIRTVMDPAFKVANLDEAIAGCDEEFWPPRRMYRRKSLPSLRSQTWGARVAEWLYTRIVYAG